LNALVSKDLKLEIHSSWPQIFKSYFQINKYICTVLTTEFLKVLQYLTGIGKANSELIESRQEGASRVEVKNLQMVQFQKAILVTGMFSLFDANL
jgi:hypothetical protein